MPHHYRSTTLAVGDFRRLFTNMISPEQIEAIGAAHHSGLGAPPKVKLADLVMGVTHQQVQGIGTRADHLQALSGLRLTDSAIAERLQALDSDVFLFVLFSFFILFVERYPHLLYNLTDFRASLRCQLCNAVAWNLPGEIA